MICLNLGCLEGESEENYQEKGGYIMFLYILREQEYLHLVFPSKDSYIPILEYGPHRSKQKE